jgi:hypothetical protein
VKAKPENNAVGVTFHRHLLGDGIVMGVFGYALPNTSVEFDVDLDFQGLKTWKWQGSVPSLDYKCHGTCRVRVKRAGA